MYRLLFVQRKAIYFELNHVCCQRSYSQKSAEIAKSVRSMYKSKARDIDAYAWFLLLMPVTAFALGTWQVKRKKWKEDLIADLGARTSLPPVEFPEDLTELSSMEYHPVRVVGQFDHSRELYLGPRSRIPNDPNTSGGSIISSTETGYQVITPFQLADRDLTILVNRGWVPQQQKNPHSRPLGQITDTVELVGIVRHTEERQPLTPQNQPQSGLWMYRDQNQMAEVTGASPICLDATASSTVPGGPVGGQTRICLRNEHLSYIFTWYGLSGATAFMWYQHFIAAARKL